MNDETDHQCGFIGEIISYFTTFDQFVALSRQLRIHQLRHNNTL
jgi:hypothetical protein